MANTIMIVAEHFKGKITEPTLEVISKAYDISKKINCRTYVLLYGHKIDDIANKLGGIGEVCYIEHELLSEFNPEIVTEITIQKFKELQPSILIIPATSTGLDIASIISAKLDVPLIASCRRIEVENNKIKVISQLYGGKINVEYELSENQVIISVLPGSFKIQKELFTGVANVKKVIPTLSPSGSVVFQRLIEPERTDIDITEIPVLVSIGRGIQNQDNIQIAQELADVLGGAVSASRPVIDLGWLPITRQVGRSGMTVKPKLYLALGISGAPEHVEGMKDSELIVAINTDSKAPIFNIAHYGALMDAVEFATVLKDKIAQRKG